MGEAVDCAVCSHKLYSNPYEFHGVMLKDIANAQVYVFLEIYKYGNDHLGNLYRQAFVNAAKRGVKVRLLLDSWGVSVNKEYFKELIDNGGEVQFFNKLLFTFNYFIKNHKRNHRKFLIIDDKIGYIGSANIGDYALNWRESMLRVEGSLAKLFRNSFLACCKIYNKYFYSPNVYKKAKYYHDFELVEDIPSIYRQHIKTRLERLIKSAAKEIIIETPYFLPGHVIRHLLAKATARGVSVTIMIPQHSDVRSVDLISSKYYGYYYENNINLYFYVPGNLHAKVLIVDDKIFALGSPNIDYRSFRYQHEALLIGTHEGILDECRAHLQDTFRDCVAFDYEAWKFRPNHYKVLGWLLLPFRHFF